MAQEERQHASMPGLCCLFLEDVLHVALIARRAHLRHPTGGLWDSVSLRPTSQFSVKNSGAGGGGGLGRGEGGYT